MAGPSSELDRAYDTVTGASGLNFFHRLRDYHQLVTEHRAFRRAVELAEVEVEAAKRLAEDEDEEFVRDLIVCRVRLVELTPEVDDSASPRPRITSEFAGLANRTREQKGTLAYFDAIVAGDQAFTPLGFDESRSRVLCEILSDKLYGSELGDAFRSPNKLGSDLRELREAIKLVRRERDRAQESWVELGRKNGYLALQRIAIVVRRLEPERSGEEPNHQQGFVEAVLMERGDLGQLKEALRPEEERTFTTQMSEAVKKHEDGCREDLENLHRALKPRLESNWRLRRAWDDLGAGNRIAIYVGGVSALLAAIAIVVAIMVAR